jgi:hypothetical protein
VPTQTLHSFLSPETENLTLLAGNEKNEQLSLSLVLSASIQQDENGIEHERPAERSSMDDALIREWKGVGVHWPSVALSNWRLSLREHYGLLPNDGKDYCGKDFNTLAQVSPWSGVSLQNDDSRLLYNNVCRGRYCYFDKNRVSFTN